MSTQLVSGRGCGILSVDLFNAVKVEVNMTILWLGDEDCHQVSRVGGKAANLSQLAASFRVPTGFCVTPELYKEWFAGTQDAGSPGWSVDADLSNIVSQEYRVMAERCGLSEPAASVRSSALDEDGHNSSFAGQYDTYLNIKGPEAIAEAIVKCWDSAGGKRMASYREEHGLSADNLGVSVLVQQLVPADVSGVVFRLRRWRRWRSAIRARQQDSTPPAGIWRASPVRPSLPGFWGRTKQTWTGWRWCSFFPFPER
ncbi:MAG: hypothetical protein CL732_00185 [Chloroflexi bacterium]|nr:hypothetical protein [Chloroflexota bacterium]